MVHRCARVKLDARAGSLCIGGIVPVTGLAARTGPDEIGGMKLPPNPDYRHRFPAEIISHAVWLYHVFSLSLRDVDLIWQNEALPSPTRRYGAGAGNSAGALPTACAAADPTLATNGTWTRSLFGSKACSIISGELLISMVLRWTSSFRNGAMRKPPSASSRGCSGDCSTSRG